MATSGIHCMQITLHHCKSASAILARNFTRMQAAIAFVQEPWVVVASAYFPGSGDDPAPPTEVEKLVDYCQRQSLPLIIGCDTNAHHVVWANTDVNDRGRRLLEFLIDTDLEILNQGNEPTFVTVNRKEALDITICNKSVWSGVRDWRVSDADSLSDHRLITFRMESKDREHKWVRNPRSTDWASYIEDLKASMECFPTSYGTYEELELAAEYLRDSIICSFERSCVVKKVDSNRGSKWWNFCLEGHRQTKEVEKARGISWRSFCEGIERVPEALRLHKLYQMILKPRFLHAVVVWWSRTQLITVEKKLDQLQAMIFRGITGAMRTTPTAALGFILAEVPLHIAAVKKAALTMIRLTAQGRWKF
ncbi:uncharacterized protein LOC122506107 [Leptopilina heterotoma]|uniref:uncharacterized protein LOC122506107 n=1 Tax=Leptopilina heterotoma TaxID=63436 RepID=UPI001CA9306B|nr:uncharacterized protein LOC122506107 [Leptopilina heterotoma]